MLKIASIDEYSIRSGHAASKEIFLRLSNGKTVFSNIDGFVATYAHAQNSPIARDQARFCIDTLGSVISHDHIATHGLTGEVEFDPEPVIGHRPPRYGRAALFDVAQIHTRETEVPIFSGLIDIKGCGVGPGVERSEHDMSNGVLFLHDAIIELINATILKRLRDRDGVRVSPVPLFGIRQIDLRARVAWAQRRLPCATLIRQAVIRQPEQIELPVSGSDEEKIQLAVEAYLLTRGLTTTGPITTVSIVKEEDTLVLRLDGRAFPAASEDMLIHYLNEIGLHPPQIIHFANVQIARDASFDPLRVCVVDLGHMRACAELPGRLGVFVRDKQLNWGTIIGRDSDNWPRRDDRLAIDHSVFGPQSGNRAAQESDLLEWLNPTASFRVSISGLLYEALRLSMLIDSDRCTEDQLLSEIETFVRQVLNE